MTALTGFVLRHRLVVVLFWLALSAAGAATVTQTTDRLTWTFDLPGSPSDRAATVLAERAGVGAEDPALLVVRAPTDLPGTAAGTAAGTVAGTAADATGRQGLERITAAVRATGPGGGARVVVPGPTTATPRTAVLSVLPSAGPKDPAAAGRALAAARDAAPAGWRVDATGIESLAGDGAPGGAGVLAETVVGATGALVVLVLVFASPLALVPLLTAAVSILTTFLLLLGLTALTSVNGIAQFLVALIGLGVAIDYSLLVVTRWREERARGTDPRTAVRVANRVAGRAVALSGITVCIGLLALVLLPMPAMRSFGYAGALIPLVSVAVAVTLVPVVLDVAGARLDRRRLPGLGRLGRRRRPAARPADGVAGWTRWARFVLRRRWAALAVGTALLVALALPALGLQPGDTRAAALATSGPARTGLDLLTGAGAPDGALTPIHVLVDTGPSATAGTTGGSAALADRLRAVPGVAQVIETPDAPGGRLLEVLPRDQSGTAAGNRTVRAVRTELDGDRAVLAVGGTGGGSVDFLDRVYGTFPALLAVVCAITFVLLLRAFRSVVLAVKAVALNLLSLGAAYGIMVTVWQHGHGSDLLWGTPATGAVPTWVPIMVFSFLFGLSMDYEVFLLSRMREARDAGAGTDEAVVEGMARTGRLVTSAALILFLAFLSMSAAPTTDVRVLATGLGAGILVDATIVRCLLVPSLVGVLGRGNWWLPGWLARLLRVPADGDGPARAALPAPASAHASGHDAAPDPARDPAPDPAQVGSSAASVD